MLYGAGVIILKASTVHRASAREGDLQGVELLELNFVRLFYEVILGTADLGPKYFHEAPSIPVDCRVALPMQRHKRTAFGDLAKKHSEICFQRQRHHSN